MMQARRTEGWRLLRLLSLLPSAVYDAFLESEDGASFEAAQTKLLGNIAFTSLLSSFKTSSSSPASSASRLAAPACTASSCSPCG